MLRVSCFHLLRTAVEGLQYARLFSRLSPFEALSIQKLPVAPERLLFLPKVRAPKPPV